MTIAEFICPDKKMTFSKISLSARTVTRRIEELATSVKLNLKDQIEQCEHYSIALDESCDVRDTPQLALFVRGVNNHFHLIEEFLCLVPHKNTTTGADIFAAVQ